MARYFKLKVGLATTTMLFLSVFATSGLLAQTRASSTATMPAVTPTLAGITLQKKPFQLTSLKGKVVLLMFWSTDCSVCRDQMSELRQNVQGWLNQPFELVLVSVDRRREDLDSYNAILNQSVSLKQRFTQLWAGDAGFKDNLSTAQMPRTQLPATYLIDKTGKLVERYNGRVPAQAWDAMADLL